MCSALHGWNYNRTPLAHFSSMDCVRVVLLFRIKHLQVTHKMCAECHSANGARWFFRHCVIQFWQQKSQWTKRQRIIDRHTNSQQKTSLPSCSKKTDGVVCVTAGKTKRKLTAWKHLPSLPTSHREAGKMCLLRSYQWRSTTLPACDSFFSRLASFTTRMSSCTPKSNRGPDLPRACGSAKALHVESWLDEWTWIIKFVNLKKAPCT